MHKPASVQENESHESLMDFENVIGPWNLDKETWLSIKQQEENLSTSWFLPFL